VNLGDQFGLSLYNKDDQASAAVVRTVAHSRVVPPGAREESQIPPDAPVLAGELDEQREEPGPQHQVAEAVARKAQREQSKAQADGGFTVKPTGPTKPSTHGQRTHLVIAFNQKRGITDRDQRLAAMNTLLATMPEPLNRQVTSSTLLTFMQARRLAQLLDAEPDHVPDAGAAPPAPLPNPRNGGGPPLPQSTVDAIAAAQHRALGLADGWSEEQADQLAADFLAALNNSPTDAARVAVAKQIGEAVKACKITSDQRRLLLDTYSGSMPKPAGWSAQGMRAREAAAAK
jgi:hypothetical protein